MLPLEPVTERDFTLYVRWDEYLRALRFQFRWYRRNSPYGCDFCIPKVDFDCYQGGVPDLIERMWDSVYGMAGIVVTGPARL